jgi:hypothetical protein
MMVARSLGGIAADALTVPERVLLFCVGSGTDSQTAGITGATVTMLAVKGLVDASASSRSRSKGAPLLVRCWVINRAAEQRPFPLSQD